MTPKTYLLAALSAATLAIPAAAAAQPYWNGGGYAQPGYGYGYRYDGGRGDYYGGRWGDRDGWRFQGYPEFRGAEDHIRREIWDALREQAIDRDDARDLMRRLEAIRAQEAREFQFHGWNLPGDDRARIRAQLDRLDRMVDRVGDEG
jgi:hypothetical protein